MATNTLEQTNGWDPLDLGTPNARRWRDEDGRGIQPDTDSRPAIRPVARPTSRPEAPTPRRPQADAPWDRR
jgi:hypothetical protein